MAIHDWCFRTQHLIADSIWILKVNDVDKECFVYNEWLTDITYHMNSVLAIHESWLDEDKDKTWL